MSAASPKGLFLTISGACASTVLRANSDMSQEDSNLTELLKSPRYALAFFRSVDDIKTFM